MLVETNDTPQHVAIIMDGNGRWAKERGLPRIDGHKAGAESVRSAVETCIEVGVKYLSLYAFSSENWNRPKAEIEALMLLLERFLKTKGDEMNQQGVKLQAIGRLDQLPSRTRKTLEKAIDSTKQNDKLTLILCLSYGSREEIVDASKAIATKVQAGELSVEQIDNQLFSQHLYTADTPDPDLLVRTSGEVRLSNFLLWQLSYAEFYITKTFWPDFKKKHFLTALSEYSRRQRRFGTLK